MRTGENRQEYGERDRGDADDRNDAGNDLAEYGYRHQIAVAERGQPLDRPPGTELNPSGCASPSIIKANLSPLDRLYRRIGDAPDRLW